MGNFGFYFPYLTHLTLEHEREGYLTHDLTAANVWKLPATLTHLAVLSTSPPGGGAVLYILGDIHKLPNLRTVRISQPLPEHTVRGLLLQRELQELNVPISHLAKQCERALLFGIDSTFFPLGWCMLRTLVVHRPLHEISDPQSRTGDLNVFQYLPLLSTLRVERVREYDIQHIAAAKRLSSLSLLYYSEKSLDLSTLVGMVCSLPFLATLHISLREGLKPCTAEDVQLFRELPQSLRTLSVRGLTAPPSVTYEIGAGLSVSSFKWGDEFVYF